MTRKSKIIGATAFIGIAVAATGVAFVVPAIAGEGKASLSEQEAQQIALRTAPGEVIDSELENEDGVMVYEFEIRQDDVIREVEVDANSGAILENATENGDEVSLDDGQEEAEASQS